MAVGSKWIPAIFIYLVLALLGLCCCADSLVVASRGYSVVAVFAFVIALASLVKHRLQGMQASVAAARGLRVASPRLSSTGSIVVVHEPRCPMVYGSSQIREQTHVFYIGRWLFFNHWASREAPSYILETELVGIFDGLVIKLKKVSTKQNRKFRKTA